METMFRPNPDKLASLTGVMRRVIDSGRQPHFSVTDYLVAKLFFSADSVEEDVLIYPNGLVLGGKQHARLTRTRALQVCFAQTNGWFPAVISRTAVEFWEPA